MGALRLGIVGLGWWGARLAAAAQSRPAEFEISRCFSPDPTEREDFACRFDARPCDTFDALLASGIDAVILATPHSLHAGQIEAAALAGKHVLVEKPLALGVAEGLRAIEACRAACVTLAVGHNRRLVAGIARIKAWIDEGRLGTLLHVEANFSTPEGAALPEGHWRGERSESPCGALTPLGIHVIDWFHFLFGPVAEVAAISHRRAPAGRIDDTAAVLLRFVSGMTGYLGCLYATPYTNEFTLYGSAAKAMLRATAPETPQAPAVLLLQPTNFPAQIVETPWVDTLGLQLERFAAAIDGRATVAVDGAAALDNVALLEAMLASAENRGAFAAPRYPGRRF